MEAITEAVSTDEVNDQIATLKEALGGLSEAVETHPESVTAPKSYKLLVAATDKMAATAADRLVNAEANIEKATELLVAFEEVKSEEERKNLLTRCASFFQT